MILQGTKETASQGGMVHLSPGDALLVSHDTPVLARITKASLAAPYVAVVVPIDLSIVRSLHECVDDTIPNREGALRKLTAGPALCDTLARWLALTPGTAEADVLTPLIRREFHFRLLTAPGGGALRQLASPNSHASRIARAIAEIRRNFTQPLRLPDLSRTACMGQSSFHAYFKAVTGTTPLQFQKDLRLTEARRLLLDGAQGVTKTAFDVGYESPAQFSREYARKFGAPPRTDLARQTAMA